MKTFFSQGIVHTMKTPETVKKAMRAMGMKAGDNVNKALAKNNAMLKKENDTINKLNKKVYNNKKNEVVKVANIIKKFENMKMKNINTKA